jgi:RNA polymerase sigma-70 factor (ECF subfamily)
MSGNRHDAEELTQETFLRALRRLDTFRPGTQMRSWLLRIATNVCLDLRRKQKRGKGVPLQEDLAGPAICPGYRLETAEQAERLRAAMQELPETARTIFHLRVQESLSFREIAELVGTTEQAARWHMHQARRKLLHRMQRAKDEG